MDIIVFYLIRIFLNNLSLSLIDSAVRFFTQTLIGAISSTTDISLLIKSEEAAFTSLKTTAIGIDASARCSCNTSVVLFLSGQILICL